MDEFAARIRQKMGHEYDGLTAVVLAYSGGLDSDVIGSVLQAWGVQVHPLIFEMGGRSDTDAIVKKAEKRFGSAHRLDITNDILLAAARGVQANALLCGQPNAGAFSRPFMARGLADVARKLKVNAIAHGASGVGNDHLRMELALRVVAPELRAMAPVRDWDLRRDEELAYAKRAGLKEYGAHSARSHFSADENVWGRSVRQGALVDPQSPVPSGAWSWTAEPADAPDAPAEVEIEFKNGMAVALEIVTAGQTRTARKKPNSSRIGADKLVQKLNELGGAHGVGRYDLIVDKVVGLKMRELHECPAAAILSAAHADLERLCLTADELEMKAIVDRRWNRLVYDGLWHSRLRRDLEAFISSTQKSVEGIVRVRLHKGGLHVVGRASRRGLYDHRLGRRDKLGMLSQSSVRSFSRLYGLQETMAALVAAEE